SSVAPFESGKSRRASRVPNRPRRAFRRSRWCTAEPSGSVRVFQPPAMPTRRAPRRTLASMRQRRCDDVMLLGGADPLSQVRARAFDVVRRALLDVRSCGAELFLDDRRRAGCKDAVGDIRTLADDAPCRNDRPASDTRAVEHDGIDPDERAAPDDAVFQDRAVSDRDVLLDDRLSDDLAHVNHGVVLNVRSGADSNRSAISANDRTEPDARFVTNLDIADHDGRRRDEGRRRDPGQLSLIFDEHWVSPENG